MRNYIYDNSWSQELEDLIEKDLAKPLIMEMFYKHGLRAYDVISTKGVAYDKDDEMIEVFQHKYMMTLDGLPYCQVYVDELRDGKLQYCFYSPYFEKERGRDRDDKRTVRASKISGLMRMLEKYKCVQDDPLEVIGTSTLNYAVSSTISELTKGSKGNRTSLHSSEQYEILNAYMTGTKLPTNKHEEIKKVFDIWHKEVETERHAITKAQSLYGSEFYVLAESKAKGICIGKAKFNFKSEGTIVDMKVEITDGFQRVSSLDELNDIDDVKAFMTMYKVYMESREDKAYRIKQMPEGKLIVSDSGYFPDMEYYCTSANYSVTNFSMNVLILPIGATTN
jgi:hypothetical protein